MNYTIKERDYMSETFDKTIRSPSEYYNNIGRIMKAVTGEEIRLSQEDIDSRVDKLEQLKKIIEKPDVWNDLVLK